MFQRIVSGGQTGVDRAALDFALLAGVPQEGWCPRGRRSEDGRIGERYSLRETPLRNYRQRTEWNVRDSDATLVITTCRLLSGGTRHTARTARKLGKPVLVIDPEDAEAVERTEAWLKEYAVGTLNVAGPRENSEPGIYEKTLVFLRALYRLR